MYLKIFITYVLLSGLLTIIFTRNYWKEVIMSYPHLAAFPQGFILFIQFIIGFIIFPYWFSTYVWIIIKSGFLKLNLGRRFPTSIGAFEPIHNEKEWQELRNNRVAELKEKYFPYINIHDMELTKEIRHILFNSPTQENLESVLIGIAESRDTVIDGCKNCKTMYLLTREHKTPVSDICYYMVVTSEKLDLLDGWKITAIINPFEESEGT